MLSDESWRRSPRVSHSLMRRRHPSRAKLSTGTLSHEDLMKASERIGELIEEMDLLTLRQLELEEKEA